jgi:hypothetical protein
VKNLGSQIVLTVGGRAASSFWISLKLGNRSLRMEKLDEVDREDCL